MNGPEESDLSLKPRIQAHANSALARTRSLGLRAIPQDYGLWYDYAAPYDLDLNTSVDRARIGVRLTKLRWDQADYIGAKVESPFTAEHYRC